MLHLHSFLRWIVIILAVAAVLKSLSGLLSKRSFAASDRKISLFFMISMDIQLLVGLVLYFTGAWGIKNIQNNGMASVMKDPAGRFFAVEHTIGMVLAIAAAHIAHSAAKKALGDQAKFRKVFLFSLISLIIMLAMIPWPSRELVGRALFPGM
ncbi:hypothetical protein [Rurimicrobium arvi]